MKKLIFLLMGLLVGSMAIADPASGNASSSQPVSSAPASQPISQHPGQWYIEGGPGMGLYYLGMFTSVGSLSAAGLEGFGWKAAVGYRPQHHGFSLEAGFIQNFYQVELTSDLTNQTATVNADIDVPYAAFRWDVPIGNRFTVIPKLGLMIPSVPSVTGKVGNETVTESGGGLVLPFTGLGFGYAISHKLSASIQYEGAIYGIAGAGLLSGNLTYYFGA